MLGNKKMRWKKRRRAGLQRVQKPRFSLLAGGLDALQNDYWNAGETLQNLRSMGKISQMSW